MSLRVLLLVVAGCTAAICGSGSATGTTAPGGGGRGSGELAAALGISFVPNSASTLVLERDGKRYVVDLASRTVEETGRAAAARDGKADAGGAVVFAQNCAQCHGNDGKGKAAFKTPDFTDPSVQASLTDEQMIAIIRNGKKGTAMPGWAGQLSDEQITAVAAYVRSLGSARALQKGPQSLLPAAPASSASTSKTYQPGDDWLMSLPTGRRLDAGGLYVNFSHRFALDPAFSGAARGGAVAGLDGFALSSLGFRYGVTRNLSVSAYRSPTFIARPVQLMAAYNLLDESGGRPLNAAVRFSVEGQDDFRKNFTGNFELILSRSITHRAQLYFVPTFSLNNRRLFQPSSYRSGAIPRLPGFNTFSTGAGGSFDVRPTLALVAEVIPTLLNGRPLGIHRPAYSFGIQKKIWHHAFTFGFTQSPGTTVSQRAGTRAQYLGDPAADKPGGMFIGFDIMRQLR